MRPQGVALGWVLAPFQGAILLQIIANSMAICERANTQLPRLQAHWRLDPEQPETAREAVGKDRAVIGYGEISECLG